LEKKRGKEEAGLVNRYKVFAKMQTAEDFEVLIDGLICKSFPLDDELT
jgi:transcriptional adapter 2-alpha